MNDKTQFQFSTSVIAYPLCFVLIIWMVFWFERGFGYHFSQYGIYPQSLKGLRGVFLSPFIHGNIKHLLNNTMPLFLLSAALLYFYKNVAWKVLFFGIILSGFFTWCIGRGSYHIGASSLIYVLVSFIFFKGLITKHYRLIALSLVVVFFYGSMIWYTLPIEKGMSWEGHLSGLITGLLFALFFKNNIVEPKKYAWQQPYYNPTEDPFLKHFDEHGNFIERLENEHHDVNVHYEFVKKDDSDIVD